MTLFMLCLLAAATAVCWQLFVQARPFFAAIGTGVGSVAALDLATHLEAEHWFTSLPGIPGLIVGLWCFRWLIRYRNEIVADTPWPGADEWREVTITQGRVVDVLHEHGGIVVAVGCTSATMHVIDPTGVRRVDLAKDTVVVPFPVNDHMPAETLDAVFSTWLHDDTPLEVSMRLTGVRIDYVAFRGPDTELVARLPEPGAG